MTYYHLSRDRLPRPLWFDLPDYPLAEPWDVEDIPSPHELARSKTPPEIARPGVFLAPSELASL